MSSNRYVTMAPMLAGPLLIALAEPLSPIDTGSDTPAERLGSILANPGRYGLTVACLLAGMLLLVPAVLTTSQAVTGRGQRTAQVGAVLAATGFMLFAVNIGAVGIGPTAWASLPEGQQAALVPAFTAMDEARGLMPLPVFGSFLPPLVGMLTLAVGLWRGRAAPRWAVVALPLGWMAFVFGPSHLVRSAGALLMLAGFLPLIGRLRAPTRAAVAEAAR
jgi:hypothetical protein